jgi:hypothetical protein
MEEVLDTYETAYDPDWRVVWMDEQPVQRDAVTIATTSLGH